MRYGGFTAGAAEKTRSGRRSMNFGMLRVVSASPRFRVGDLFQVAPELIETIRKSK